MLWGSTRASAARIGSSSLGSQEGSSAVSAGLWDEVAGVLSGLD